MLKEDNNWQNKNSQYKNSQDKFTRQKKKHSFNEKETTTRNNVIMFFIVYMYIRWVFVFVYQRYQNFVYMFASGGVKWGENNWL